MNVNTEKLMNSWEYFRIMVIVLLRICPRRILGGRNSHFFFPKLPMELLH